MTRMTAIAALLLAASLSSHATVTFAKATSDTNTFDTNPSTTSASAPASAPAANIEVSGLGTCSTIPEPRITIGNDQPATIIVHGQNGHPAHFEKLAGVFAANRQLPLCFSYDDRASLEESAAALKQAIEKLSVHTSGRLTIVGHSLGGLVARAALSDNQEQPVGVLDNELQLITVATPFAGVRKARHCVSPVMKVITLGLSGPTCRIVSGDKWHEITHASDFIRQPGQLSGNVSRHLKIATDEEHACKNLLVLGPCLPGGYVFTLQEQFHPLIDEAANVTQAVIQAGHREIIESEKLVWLLARNGIVNPATTSLAANRLPVTNAGYGQKISL